MPKGREFYDTLPISGKDCFDRKILRGESAVQDDFQHELGAQIGQNKEAKATQRPAHRGMAAPAVEVMTQQQYCKHRPGSYSKQYLMIELQRMAEYLF